MIEEEMDEMDEIDELEEWCDSDEDEDEDHHSYWSGLPLPSGYASPKTYAASVVNWYFFVDFYQKEQKKNKNAGWKYDVPALENIMRVAPQINDERVINNVLSALEYMKLERYDIEYVKKVLNTAETLADFRKRYITHQPTKQVDLVKILKPLLPEDLPSHFASSYFYVLRQFGLVHVEKRGRYNFVSIK